MGVVLKYWREVVIVGLLAIIFISVQTCQSHKENKDRLNSNLKISQDSVHHFRNKNKELVGEVGVMQLSLSDAKEYGRQLNIAVDSLQKQVGGLKNLVTYYKGQVRVQGSFSGIVHDTIIERVGQQHDTTRVKEKKFEWTNKYLTLSTLYNPANDSMHVHYRYETGFTLVVYRKPHSLLSFKRDLVADFTLKDPNGTLINGQSVIITPPPKKFYEKTWFHMLTGAVIATYTWERVK